MNAMTDDEWTAIALVIEEAWWGDFEPPRRKVYRSLLAPFGADRVMAAVVTLVHRGNRFRPAAAEIVAAIAADPGKPTFDEAHTLMFGRGGALKARPAFAEGAPAVFRSGRERSAAETAAILARADELHPYLGAFMRTYGVDRLRRLPLDDPTYGEKRRQELKVSWDEFVVAADERAATGRALASTGRAREIGPRRLDPLGVLGLAPRAELSPGEEPTR